MVQETDEAYYETQQIPDRRHSSCKSSESLSENVGRASSLPVQGASSPRVPGGRMPPEPADKMSAPHFQTGAKGKRRQLLRLFLKRRQGNARRCVQGSA
jgi:hypothetical protein